MPSAARIGDHHTCPAVGPGQAPHVGGPMLSLGCPSVLIEDRPAAREGDHAACAVAVDRVRLGEPSVLIGNRPAARRGDPTEHGGVIAAGASSVLIGSTSQAITLRRAAVKGAAFCEECARRQRERKPPPAPRATRHASAKKPPSAPLASPVLGRLSARYETSGRGPATIAHNAGDAGGASYGSYQIATATGTMTHFIAWLGDVRPEWRARLREAPQGSAKFDGIWRAIAAEEPQAFFDVQHRFIEETHYRKALASLTREDARWAIEGRSRAVRDAFWSTAVQHGPDGAVRVFRSAARRDEPSTLDDETLLRRVYTERGRNDGRAWFPSSSPAIRQGVVRRFRDELADALTMLKTEREAAAPQEGS